jgi:hypothetical protein
MAAVVLSSTALRPGRIPPPAEGVLALEVVSG